VRVTNAYCALPENCPDDLVDSLLVFNHTVVLSGGELALISLIKGGLAKKVHVHVDQPGDLTTALDELGREVSWSAMSQHEDFGTHVGRSSGVRPALRRIGIALKMRRSYAQTLEANDYSLIYANTLRSVLILCTLNLRNKPLVFHQRDRLAGDYLGWGKSILAKLLIASRVKYVIANSAATALTTPRTVGNIHVVPSAVDREYYELPIPSNDAPVSFVMVGRLTEWKGQSQFLKSLVYLRDVLKCTNWSAKIVGGALFGESEYEDELRRFIADNGLEGQVELTGHTIDVVSQVKNSHVLVHASIVPEPFGQVVAQGMAAARAVVASSTGGPAEMLVNDVSGILVDPSNTASLAQALRSLVGSPELRQKLGTAARAEAQRFTVEAVGASARRFLCKIDEN
jgi:glycosyltransferase involved in cell wall biosynthesis